MCYNWTMDAARVKAYAKLNLTLFVTGEEGGYHNLDSLVTTVDLYDVVKVAKRRRDGEVRIEMHGRGSEIIDPEKNNAYRAAKAYVARYGCGGADITVYKNIPMEAGLGGSSADAAGVLKAMSRLYPQDDPAGLGELADGVGSDVRYLTEGGYARLFGRGDRVVKVDGALKLYFMLLLPPEGVSTAECFKICRISGGGNSDEAEKALVRGDAEALGKLMQNDLFAAAQSLNGDIARAAAELKEFDPLGVCMTGSGSGVFAAFSNPEFRDYAISRYGGKFKVFSLKTH